MAERKLGIALDLHSKLINPSSRKDNYFESCMDKLEFMLENCDALILCGDIFEKARSEDIVKNRILSLIDAHKKPVFVILGNHDIEKDNVDTLHQTSLGNLLCHKAVTLLTPDKIWNIFGLRIGVLDYNIQKAKAQTFPEIDILLGHHFYNWTRDLNQSLEEKDVSKYNAKHIFLGHDHEPHPDVVIGTSVIHRFGSVMRDELNAYTPSHQPKFACINVADTAQFEIEMMEIPCIPYEDAFFYQEKAEFKRCTKLMTEIKDFLESMDIKPEGKKTLGEILKEDLKAPTEVLDYLSLVYRVHHLPF